MTDYTKSTTVTLASFEATLATALENARNNPELSAKAVIPFLEIQKQISAQPDFSKALDALRKAREDAKSGVDAAWTKVHEAEETLHDMEARSWVVRVFNKEAEKEAAKVLKEAEKEALTKAQKALEEASEAHTEALNRLKQAHALKVEYLKGKRNSMRDELKKHIDASLSASHEAPATAADETVSLEEAALNSIREEFLKRELFKEAVIRAVVKEFASGSRCVLVQQEVLSHLSRGVGHRLDSEAMLSYSDKVAAEWLARQVRERIPTSVLNVSAKMEKSDSYGSAYIEFSY